jgi:hypothetical protein
MVKQLFAVLGSLLLALAPGDAVAMPGTFRITQIYSNADGSVQFVVVFDNGNVDCDSTEALWAGFALYSMGSGPSKTFVFPNNLPTCATTKKTVLIATEGFAALGLVTPDFVMPNGFLQRPAGSVALANHHLVNYTALPDDGIHALAVPLIGFGVSIVPNVATNLAGASASVVPGPPAPAAIVPAIEYYHAGFDHYFITAIGGEIAALDQGTLAGWSRTGRQFNVRVAATAGAGTVCRFFSTAFGVKGSHFYTPDANECTLVKANPLWQFEGEVFHVATPAADGACPDGTVPVYRLYNEALSGAPNHRYTTDLAVRAAMIGLGWTAEGYGPVGVVMCSPA